MIAKVMLTMVLVAATAVVWGMWWDSIQKAEPVGHYNPLEDRPITSETLKMSWAAAGTVERGEQVTTLWGVRHVRAVCFLFPLIWRAARIWNITEIDDLDRYLGKDRERAKRIWDGEE